jgi:hypothetical protein
LTKRARCDIARAVSRQLSRTARIDECCGTVAAMLKRGLLLLATLYIAAALVGHVQERFGAIRCECREDCWCKRPGLSFFRWVFAFGHR